MFRAHCPLPACKRLSLIGLLLLTGCASLQPSYYANTSRDGENRVIAQGQAASNAAWVHASTATLGHGPVSSGAALESRPTSAQRDVLADSGRRIYEEAMRTTTSALSSAVDQSVREALR